MAEFTVKEINFEEKSKVELENELLKAHEEEQNKSEEQEVITPADTTEEVIEDKGLELDDNTIISHLKTRYGKDINTLDELFQERQANEELPEDVSAFLKYKKETGRSFEDFVSLNKDYEKESPEKLLADFYKANNPDYDDDIIEFELERFKYDEDLDDAKEIKAKQVAFKKEVSKAKEYFNSLKEQYKVPLESRSSFVPQEERDTYEAFKANKQSIAQQQEENLKRSEYFAAKTNELFSEKFEGFGFNIDENNKVVYKPADAKTLKDQQSSLNNFVSSFLDDKGFLKDAEAFHKAIAVAQNPESFAKFFYDKGKADMATGIEKDSKNIEMTRNAPTPTPQNGFRVQAIDDDFGNGLKIKKR
jgi:hypothetical protein